MKNLRKLKNIYEPKKTIQDALFANTQNTKDLRRMVCPFVVKKSINNNPRCAQRKKS